MRVAIVHDDLVQWGGAERVLLGICEIFPDAPIYTSVYDIDNLILKDNFVHKKIITSFLQKIPGWRSLYKTLLPFYPIAFEQFSFDGYDLVISQTTRFAKSIITRPGTVHICYCHTPPRFLWHFSEQKNYGILEPIMSKLRIYDQVSKNRVDYFIAGSENARKRIKRVYKVDSKVVYPFVDLKRFEGIETFDGGYFVVVTRTNKYKRVDLTIEACKRLVFSLKVIGKGDWVNGEDKGDVEFLGELNDQMVVKVLAGCRALIIPGIEDFGIISLEAQALGKPVIAYKGGGALETVINGKTGILFNKQNVESLTSALIGLNDSQHFRETAIKRHASYFSKESFHRAFKQTVDSLVY
ncbi:MAG: glycosyltransferase [Patescibacteria group bacterium]